MREHARFTGPAATRDGASAPGDLDARETRCDHRSPRRRWRPRHVSVARQRWLARWSCPEASWLWAPEQSFIGECEWGPALARAADEKGIRARARPAASPEVANRVVRAAVGGGPARTGRLLDSAWKFSRGAWRKVGHQPPRPTVSPDGAIALACRGRVRDRWPGPGERCSLLRLGRGGRSSSHKRSTASS